MRGRFITFEGGEGTGKSTHASMLAERLRAAGLAVQQTREPGGSPGAEIMRYILLSGAARPLGADAEALLFAAARDDHLTTLIRPALAQGKWVVSDRFEGEALAFHERLRDGFLMLAANEPDRCVLIDATTPKEEVTEQIWRVVQKRLNPATASTAAEDAGNLKIAGSA
jgi:thymidylate kinase